MPSRRQRAISCKALFLVIATFAHHTTMHRIIATVALVFFAYPPYLGWADQPYLGWSAHPKLNLRLHLHALPQTHHRTTEPIFSVTMRLHIPSIYQGHARKNGNMGLWHTTIMHLNEQKTNGQTLIWTNVAISTNILATLALRSLKSRSSMRVATLHLNGANTECIPLSQHRAPERELVESYAQAPRWL